MNRTSLITLALLLIVAAIEPALANKFETIGGGVSGMDKEKIELLQTISLYAGGFFFFLAITVALTRNRFEGFVGYSSRKDQGIALKGAATLMVVAFIFVGLSYI